MHPLTEWIRYVEENGSEVAVTVVIGGTVISGMLSPFARYERWGKEIDQRTRLAGGAVTLPNIKLPPLTAEERAEFREQWQVRLAAARAEHGYPADDDVPPGLLDYFCLANARMRTVTYEFIIVHTASVGAFFPGRLAQQARGEVG
jgi:hypothetical protein